MSVASQGQTRPESAQDQEARPSGRTDPANTRRSLRTNFLDPAGDPGLTGPGSINWRVFNNPITNAVGGIAAVILELSEPAVRAGVWDHSTFKVDPIKRMRSTNKAAETIVYGPTEAAHATFERVTRLHERVTGETHEGKSYRAMDPPLLTWVHTTAGWGFLNAYRRYVEPDMSRADQDRYYLEREQVGYHFGAEWVPKTVDEVEAYMETMLPKLYVNDTVPEFIRIVGDATPVGALGKPFQRLLVQAAIDLLTGDMQRACGVRVTRPLRHGLRFGVKRLVRVVRHAQRFSSKGAAQQACRRMSVSTDCLYP